VFPFRFGEATEQGRLPAFAKATAGQRIARRKVMVLALSLTTMTDSLHSHNSKYNGLRPSLASSLVANAHAETA
jgi:hypothetical protein